MKYYFPVLSQRTREMPSISHQNHNLQITEYFLSAHKHGASEQLRQIIFLHLPEKGSVNSLEFCRMRFITSCAASYLAVCTTHSCQPPDLIIPCFHIQHPPEIPSYVLKYVTAPSKLLG